MPRERMDARSGQLASRFQRGSLEQVLAHCSGLSYGARLALTGNFKSNGNGTYGAIRCAHCALQRPVYYA